LAEYLRPLADRNTWSAAWSRPGFPVTALGVTPDGTPELVAADALGRLFGYGPGRPHQIAIRDGRSLLALDSAGALHPLCDPEDTGTHHTLANVAAFHGAAAVASPDAAATALGGSPDGRYAVVGNGEGRVHLWSLRNYQPGPQTMDLHCGKVLATACLPLPGEGLDLVFSAGLDGTVRLWETSADPMPDPVSQRRALATALAAADTSTGPLLAAAWNDSELHIWQILSVKSRTLPLAQPASALAFTQDGLLAIGGPYGVWAMRIGPNAF
jgi:WD40 repeat protein